MTNYLTLTSAEAKEYNKMLELVEPKEREAVMEWSNEWIEQGRQEGLQKGREEGRQQGQRDLVRRQLRRQIGAMPAKVAKRIDHLDDDELFALGDALLDFKSLADAQEWLAQHKPAVRAAR